MILSISFAPDVITLICLRTCDCRSTDGAALAAAAIGVEQGGGDGHLEQGAEGGEGVGHGEGEGEGEEEEGDDDDDGD